MERPAHEQELRSRLFTALVEATFPLKKGPDPEVILELLIEAAGMLQEHLEKELQELREEQAD
jgi:hypothetical protein